MNTSYIIITFNRYELLKKCLNSLLLQINPNDQIIVVLNGKELVHSNLIELYPKINFHMINNTTPAAARNYALQFAANDWLCFLDDDTYLPENYINKSLEIINKYDPDVFGGPDVAPPNSNNFENALSLALKSPLTTAHTRHRHKSTKQLGPGSESNLILCHLWIKKILLEEQSFNPYLQRNEENYLLDKLLKLGANILYVPQLWIYHHRKKNLIALYHAVSTSGKFRAKTIVNNPQFRKIIYFVPIIFNLYLILLFAFPIFYLAIPMLIYLSLNIITSLKETLISKKLRLLALVSAIQFFIVVFYGIGFLKGLSLVCFSLFRGRGIGLGPA